MKHAREVEIVRATVANDDTGADCVYLVIRPDRRDLGHEIGTLDQDVRAGLVYCFATHGVASDERNVVLQLATAIPGLILAPVIRRMPDQRPAAVSVSLISAASLLGLIYLPGLAVVWAALLGFGSGASMILGLTFVGLRTRSAGVAGALSGMAQCIGYLMAAAGPMVVGAIHDWQRGWSVALLMAAGVALLGAWAGLLAGRKVRVEA